MTKNAILQLWRQGDGQGFLTYVKEGTPQDQLCDTEGNCSLPTGGVKSSSGNPLEPWEGTTPTPTTPVTTPAPSTTLPPAPVDEPVSDSGPVPIKTTIPDATLEVDFSQLSCQDLNQLIDYTMTKQQKKMALLAMQYYQNKLNQLNAVYYNKNCRVGSDPIDAGNGDTTVPDTSAPPPASGGGTGPTTTISPSTATPTGTVTITAPAGTAVVTGGVGAATGGGSGGGGGAAGGGGGGGEKGLPVPTKADLKKNWWLIALCAVALGVSLYQGRNTTINLPK